MKHTIFKIVGGLQAVRNNSVVTINIIENSDYPELSGVKGRHTETEAWDTDLDELKKEVRKINPDANYNYIRITP